VEEGWRCSGSWAGGIERDSKSGGWEVRSMLNVELEFSISRPLMNIRCFESEWICENLPRLFERRSRKQARGSLSQVSLWSGAVSSTTIINARGETDIEILRYQFDVHAIALAESVRRISRRETRWRGRLE
jgi:hypothetical protein